MDLIKPDMAVASSRRSAVKKSLFGSSQMISRVVIFDSYLSHHPRHPFCDHPRVWGTICDRRKLATFRGAFYGRLAVQFRFRGFEDPDDLQAGDLGYRRPRSYRRHQACVE
jgi:hypothetical protein